MKVAIASTKDGLIFPGHFAHSETFRIYEYEGGQLKLLEVRENPLGNVPDLDAGHHHHHHGHHHAHGMHGVQKYAFLREKVLPDVDVVIAGGACQTSFYYFTSNGVKVLFTDPVPVDLVEQSIREDPKSFEQALNAEE